MVETPPKSRKRRLPVVNEATKMPRARIVPPGAPIPRPVRVMMKNWGEKFTRINGRPPTVKEMSDRFDRHESVSVKVLNGQLDPKHAGGRPRTLNAAHRQYLRAYALANPTEKLNLYASAIFIQFPPFGPYGLTAPPANKLVSEALTEMGLSRQARRALNARRGDADIELYAFEFLMTADGFDKDVAWFDASGVNRHTGVRTKGWAVVGSGGCGARQAESRDNITVFGLMDHNGYFGHRSYDGGTTLDRVNNYFLEVVTLLVNRGIKCVILDNASTHALGWLSAILSVHGIFVLFLPNYHPDWNPIEQMWKAMKGKLTEWRRGHCDIHRAVSAVPKEQCLSFIRHTRAYPAFLN